MPERLLRDMHPVEVYAPHAMTAPVAARVFVTDERVQVWVDAPSGRPAILLEAPTTSSIEAERGSLFGQVQIDTAEGPIHVTRGQGCGCHSPLKALMAPASW